MRRNRRSDIYVTGKIEYIKTIELHPSQSRVKRYKKDDITALAMSVKRYGVVQPLLVRDISDGYEIVTGERRFLAAQLAGKTELPCIRLSTDSLDAYVLSVSDDLSQRTLDIAEEAHLLGSLREMLGGGLAEIAQRLGVTARYAAAKLKLLELPSDLLTAVKDANLHETYALELTRITDDRKRAECLSKIIAESMSAERCCEIVDRALSGEDKATEEKPADPVPAPSEPKLVIKDHRFYVNSIEHGASTMRKNGVRVALDRDEDEKRIIYTIVIPKARPLTA